MRQKPIKKEITMSENITPLGEKTKKTNSIQPENHNATFSVFQTSDGSPLSKSFFIDNGELRKVPGGMMTSGTGHVQAVSSLHEFAKVIEQLTPDQALCYGIPRNGMTNWNVCTSAQWNTMGKANTHLPRTDDQYHFPKGPGILQMDYDPDGQPKELTPEILVGVLQKIFPAFSGCGWISKPSNSSGLTHADTGAILTSNAGFRLYFIVKNARLIPQATKLIEQAMWAYDFGWVKISRAGTLLSRIPIDMAVYQASRLDFAGPPNCNYPVAPPGIGCTVHEGEMLDLMKLETIQPEIERAAKERLASAKAAKREEAKEVRERYIRDRSREIVGDAADPSGLARAEDSLRRALDVNALGPDFIIEVETELGIEKFRVSDLLTDPVRFHGYPCCDPLEPDYHDGALVGKIYTLGGRPNINSFAHGGRNYRLLSEHKRVQVIAGRTNELVDQVIQIVQDDATIYNYGKIPAEIDGDRIHTLEEHSLAYVLSRIIRFYKVDMKGGTPTEKDVDPPEKMVKTLISLIKREPFPLLTGVLDHPLITPEGRLLDSAGYDQETGLYLSDSVNSYTIPHHPTEAELRAALECLWYPFREFPFVTPIDCGVYLAALLSAISRLTIGTCPGFGLDAPEQGSGKTLLARCIGILATGGAAPITPWSTRMNDEEIRKRIFADILCGERCVILDNLLGIFNSGAMAGYLTSSNISERILGVSEKPTVPNRVLFLFTGNNLEFAGDMPRRVLVSRIDAKVADPTRRKFDLDPSKWVLANRRELIEAGLTLIKGKFTWGCPDSDDSTASFEDWDKLIRQTVRWVGNWDSRFADPSKALQDSRSRDPEREQLGELLLHLLDLFGPHQFAARDVMDQAKHNEQLMEHLEEFIPRAPVTSVKIGKQLKYRVDRRVHGLALSEGSARNGSNTYKVQMHDPEELVLTLECRGLSRDAILNADGGIRPPSEICIFPKQETGWPNTWQR